MKKKIKKGAFIAFRTTEANKEYLIEICEDNDLKESQVMDAILSHYLQSGIVIILIKEIKRNKK